MKSLAGAGGVAQERDYDMITCVHDFKKSLMHVNGLNPGLHLLRLLSVDPSTLLMSECVCVCMSE